MLGILVLVPKRTPIQSSCAKCGLLGPRFGMSCDRRSGTAIIGIFSQIER